MYDYYDEEFRAIDVKARFEQRKHLRLPQIKNTNTHGKEYHFSMNWSGDGQKFINYKLDFYDGRLYYLDCGYLFSSKEDGTERQILLKIGDYFITDTAVSVKASTVFIAVNRCGVYLYQHNIQSTMRLFTHAGRHVKDIVIPGLISQVYIAEDYVYYVLSKSETKYDICCLDTTNSVTTIIMEASKVLELYGTKEKVITKTYYENEKNGTVFYDEGWYLHSMTTGKNICLSSGNCPPHYVFTHPDAYIKGNANYIDFKDKLIIRSVDLIREIMWIATPLKEKLPDGITSHEYWEPMQLAFEGAPITEAPIWRVTPQQFSPGARNKQVNDASYFDGTCFLNGRSIYYMKVFDIEGRVRLHEQGDEKGDCHIFRVLNGYAYADFNGNGWEQHEIVDTQPVYVRTGQLALPYGISREVRNLIRNFSKK